MIKSPSKKGILSSLFSGCTNLKNVTIGNNVTFIGKSAFRGLTKLENVTMGQNVTLIRTYAFAGCTGLRQINISRSVKTIGVIAFQNCKKLSSVTLSTKVLTTVKTKAFYKTKKGIYFIVPSGKKSTYKVKISGTGASKYKIITY